MNKNILALTVASVLLATNTYAANQVADARGNAMGNTGVASADYLTAPFYNPALATSFKNNDDFGFFLAVSASAKDSDDSFSSLDDLQTSIDDMDQTAITQYLEELDGNAPLLANAGSVLLLPYRLTWFRRIFLCVVTPKLLPIQI